METIIAVAAPADTGRHWVPILISSLALGFTIFSFWWLYARRGRLIVTTPRAYAFAVKGKQLRLRVPLVFYNTGAAAFVVNDLRLIFVDDPLVGTLDWITTRSTLRPSPDDGHTFAIPFSVDGRKVTSVITEFGKDDEVMAAPEGNERHRLVLQGLVGEGDWADLLRFDWWSPFDRMDYRNYVSYRNLPQSRPVG